jgi:thiamine-phosphate pyrophosphorylase
VSASDLLADRRLYLCTPDRADLERFVGACISGGVDLVQLREKHLDDRSLWRRARLLGRVCADRGVPFVVNDRADIALDVEGAGVHVGQDDLPVGLVRRLVGAERLVGLSTHASPELTGALEVPIDYCSAGPVVATPTKPGRAGTGLEYLAEAARRCAAARNRDGGLPVFVTGGVTPGVVPALVAAGADRFVVVRYLTEAPDPRAAAAELASAIRDALERREAVTPA